MVLGLVVAHFSAMADDHLGTTVAIENAFDGAHTHDKPDTHCPPAASCEHTLSGLTPVSGTIRLTHPHPVGQDSGDRDPDTREPGVDPPVPRTAPVPSKHNEGLRGLPPGADERPLPIRLPIWRMECV